MAGSANSEALILKLDSGGNQVWQRTLGGSDFGSGAGYVSLSLDGSNNILAAGGMSGYYVEESHDSAIQIYNWNGFGLGFFLQYNQSGQALSVHAMQFESFSNAISGDNYLFKVISSGNENWAIGGSYNGITKFGDRQLRDSFVVRWNGTLINAPEGNGRTLTWDGGLARSRGIALGSGSFADGGVAVGRGYAVGSNTFAAGVASATTEGASAFGIAKASGAYSFAVGKAKAIGGYSFASGNEESFASGDFSIAMGYNNQSGGFGAIAIGTFNTSSNAGGIALGSDNYVSNGYAFGQGNQVYGGGLALGIMNYITGVNSFAIGTGNEPVGQGAFAIGHNLIGYSNNVTVMGNFNTYDFNASGQDDLFVLGNGISYSQRSNAMVVKNNGEIRVKGAVKAKGGFRSPPMGDIGMGVFTAGDNPEDLNKGLYNGPDGFFIGD